MRVSQSMLNREETAVYTCCRILFWTEAILSENEKQEILTAIQSIFATGYTGEKELLTKLSAIFNVNTRNWLEVDFSRWGKTYL